MEALPSEILRKIGDYLMPEPLTIHMILLSERLDFEVCGESMEPDSPNDVLLAKKRFVKDLHSFGKTCWAAQNTKNFIFRQQLTVCFFHKHIFERVLKTQNLQPFRSVVVAFKDVGESILPSLCQLSKFSGLAQLQVRFLVSHTMKAPGCRQFQQRIEEKLHFLTIKPDIKLTTRPKSPQLSQIFRTGHWFNHKCQEYYSPTKFQWEILSRVVPSKEDGYLGHDRLGKA